MFSNCSGECCLCACGGGCLAGNGDDDFLPASKEQIIERLDKGEYKDYTQMMKDHLKHQFGYDYERENGRVLIPCRLCGEYWNFPKKYADKYNSEHAFECIHCRKKIPR